MVTKQKHKLLVIDDSSLIRSSLSLVLAESGFEVKTASNIEEFEALLGEWWPDTILSDVQMPDMTGDQLCRTLKSRLLVRVVLFSNLHPTRLAELAESAGADGYISKLAGFESLPDSLTEIIHRTGGSQEEEAEATAEPERPCRILLVDDTELGREVTGTILDREGFDVRIASTVADFADVFGSWQADIVLTVPSIGSLQSADLCDRIKEHTGAAKTPIVLYGDSSSDVMNQLASESGAHLGLSKIEGYDQLLGKLRGLSTSRG